MNLAIEYMLRKERIRKLLCLPCSLFLTDQDKHKMIVTINQAYGPKTLIVKHWFVEQSKKQEILPPFSEYAVPPEELFVSNKIVLKDSPWFAKLLQFQEEPYITGLKQHSDLAHAAVQEVEYNDCLANFLNPRGHKKTKTDWLWEVFSAKIVPDPIKSQYTDKNADMQRQLVGYYCKPSWGIWEYWKKHLLDFEGPAAELVFASAYGVKFPSPEEEKPCFRYGYYTSNYWGTAYPTNSTAFTGGVVWSSNGSFTVRN